MSIPDAQADRHPVSSPGMGWGALLSGTNGVRSLALAGGVVLHAINIYIATTILPSVVQDIGGLDLYAWNTTVFVVASILGSALSAKLLQVAGPRGAYATGAVIFALGALICAVSPSMPVMLFGRLIQGLGGGFLFALAYAMIRVVFEPTLWPRAMALVSGMWGVATLVGPAVGGIFAELGVWRAAFWSLAPAALLFALLAAAVLPARDAEPGRKSSIPFPQILLLVAAVLAISAGSTSPDLLTGVLKAARPSEQELAGASITTVQLFATAIGAALAGMVVNAGGLIEPGGVAGTANAALWLFGAFTFLPAIGLFTARRAARL
nr:MFS transporter [uncultured Roseococcus sp.]